MNDIYLTAIIAGLVPAVAYVVTTMITTRRNSEDIKNIMSEIKDIRLEIKSQDNKFTVAIKALDDKFSTRLVAIENDVAVIKALCQERSDRIHRRNS
ncbi:MAG: hypothetical protein Ta2B_22920 [Termitinemataceae bacterium]|nr:MAG: hypothetical protein Ta2B_22920 [Termitinemataceae bacterium]